MLGCLRAQPFVTVELYKLFQNECLAAMCLPRLLREPATTTSTTQKFAKLPCGSELYSLYAIDATTRPLDHTPLLEIYGKQLKCTRDGVGKASPLARVLVDLLDLGPFVGRLLGRRAAAHATHVGHTCGEKTSQVTDRNDSFS